MIPDPGGDAQPASFSGGKIPAGVRDVAAKFTEQLLALSLTLVGGVVLGAIIGWLAARFTRRAVQNGAWLGLIVFIAVGAVEVSLGLAGQLVVALAWLALVFVGWGTLLGGLLKPRVASQAAPAAVSPSSRRQALLKIAGSSVAVAAGAWGLGNLLQRQQQATGASQPLANLPTSAPTLTPTPRPSPTVTGVPTQPAGSAASLAAAPEPPTPIPAATAAATTRDRLSPAPGTRPELTANKDFYRIDINTRPVVINRADWQLQVAGLFENARSLTFEDLMAYPAVTQPITLSCISNPVAGDLISTSNFTGVRLRDLLQKLGLRPEAKELYIQAEDGFYESVAMADLMDPRTLLVYGMNGETLPVEHGFPLRIYIPNRYGMKQPKWITRIEAIDHMGPGYWVDRGWSAEARPQIVSVIDTVAQNKVVNEKIPVGGIAWAGDRGIQKVELQVDGGEWQPAMLRVPPLGPLTWVQWRYDWPAMTGRHTFTVRATDGTGTEQIEKVQGVRPDGATGYHSVTTTISDV